MILRINSKTGKTRKLIKIAKPLYSNIAPAKVQTNAPIRSRYLWGIPGFNDLNKFMFIGFWHTILLQAPI
jgi:hypothetical protein